MFNEGLIVMIITQIRQLDNLTSLMRALFQGKFKKSSPWLYLSASFVLTMGSAAGSLAQSTSNQVLPPPPPLKNVTPVSGETILVGPQKTTPLPVEATFKDTKTTQPLREYTFQAPQTLPAKNLPETTNIQSTAPTLNSQPTGNVSFYRVEVSGTRESLLSQVKVIEPMAFIRQNEGVIHGGMFQNSQQAQQRVQELKNKGITANIVPVYQEEQQSLSVQITPYVKSN